MATMSLIEKLSILLEISKSSKVFIIALIAFLILGIILFTTNKKNMQSSKSLFIALYLFIVVAAFTIYKDSLNYMLEYLMNNLFIVIYFPNLAVYLAAILVANIILMISVFNTKTNKVIRNINITISVVINYLLFVLLYIINAKKLDVFDQSSIYGNKTAQAVIELTSTLFILWIVFITIFKIISLFQKNKEESQAKIKTTNKRKLPNNINEIPVPYIVKATPKVAPKIEKNKNLNINQFDNLLTLDDYKLLLSMLKEHKEKERKEKLLKEKREKELSKFNELQELYRVR